MSSTPYPLGIYIGNPVLAAPAAQAAYEANFQATVALFGAQPSYITNTIDPSLPLTPGNTGLWLNNTGVQAYFNAQTPESRNLIPVIGLPMNSIAGGSVSADTYYQQWAAGDYDSMLQAMVLAWKHNGYLTQYWRPGWEMNVSGVGYNYGGNTAAQRADWIAAFQHIYTVLHAAAAADGVNLQVIWNPDITSYSNAGSATQTLYPGNQYVDIIGADVYSDLFPYTLYDWAKNNGTVDATLQQWAANPVNLQHYYNYPAATPGSPDSSGGHALSLLNLLAFAKAQGKPVAIVETGAGSTVQDHAGVTDNPTFVNWLAATLKASGDTIDFVNIWDVNDGGGKYAFSKTANGKPLEEAAWANDFGAQGVTATITGRVLHFGASTDPVSGSADAGVTVSLLDVAGDVIKTTVSAADGTFSFGSLPAGTYQLLYTPPANQTLGSGGGEDPTTGLTAQFTVGVGQTYAAPNGALISVGSVNGQVVLDGVGDYLVPVALLNAAGTVVATTTTDSNGDFSFINLATGTYQVQYTPPRGQILDPASLANPTTGLTPDFTVAYGTPTVLGTENLLPPVAPATITGLVLHFGAAADGPSGSPEAGVTVSLVDSSGTVLATTVSASDGSYSFANLVAGTYQVMYTPPANQSIEPGSLVNASTDLTAPFSVAAGQTVDAPTGAMVSLGSIAGEVLLNGSADSGVTVTLLGAAGALLATTTTSSGGGFTFSDVSAGSYTVKYTAPSGQIFERGSEANVATGVSPTLTLGYGQALSLPAELLLTPAMMSTINATALHFGGPTDPAYGTGESGVTVELLNAAGAVIASGVTGANGFAQFNRIGAGTYQLEYVPPAGQVIAAGGPENPTTGLTAQFTVGSGVTVAAPNGELISAASVSGQALLNGAADAGVAVALLDTSGDVLASTTTNSAGDFTFTNLAAGTYVVQYTAPQGQALASGGSIGESAPFTLAIGTPVTLAAESFTGTTATIDSQVLHFDSPSDPVSGSAEAGVTVTLLDTYGDVIASTVSASDGTFSFTGVTAGTYQLEYTPPSGQAIEPGSLADPTTGLTAAFTVTGGQTLDAPAGSLVTLAALDGQVLLSGAGEDGVAVSLLNASGVVVASTTTDTSGDFSFANLAAGTYQLDYTPPAGLALAAGSAANVSTGLTPTFSLAYGETFTAPTELLSGTPGTVQSNVSLFSVGTNVLWVGGDQGVSVSLINAAGAVVATTVSDGHGWFEFTNVTPGSYQLDYTPPSGQAILAFSAANQATGLTAAFTVTAGTTTFAPSGSMITLGSVVLASIAGEVELSGTGESGVAVSLVNAAGTVMATSTTDTNGNFTFTGLQAGSYQVDYSKPAGQVFEIGSEANAAGLSPSVTLTAGQTLSLPAEILLTRGSGGRIESNVHHFGGLNDPSWGGGDPGVTVSLLNASGTVIASTTTAGNGWFSFDNLAAGTYQLDYTPPAGQAIEPGGVADPTTGLTGTLTVAAGQTMWAPDAALISALTLNGTDITAGGTNGSYLVTGNASDSTLTLGNGNQVVTLTGTGNTVTAGNGNDTITLSGSGNSVAVGTGNSTINAGSGNAVVHAGGGAVSITAAGTGNLFDAGSGIGFLYADGSGGNEYLLNQGGSGLLTTITGFNAASDQLDLARTLAGTNVAGDLSNISNYITAVASGGNMDLYVDPTGGSGTPSEFGVLVGVQVTVAQLQAAHDFVLS